ncbi:MULTISPECIES: cation-translocating P-type ATPase [Sphingobacterium]|uniref:cation-translocating P-type ATPase n=1 Tax=Sphingobacterium TaxID=28453 RepID=UPI000DFDEF12|nr:MULTISPECIES: cation-translocating P-type ATPase [Sphingobacterium]MBB1645454.1 haloacid dehalogenase [Sphingobacterium sp. UME9]QQT43520.1 cation-translocating P-type ATPase [Sphingobacterium multivorum]SUI97986.1 Calcium-transporting ATPase lmo0841 [Sphingobacterium multivorum]
MTTYNIPKHLTGLSEEELKISQNKFGYNHSDSIKKNTWYNMLLAILKEPMLLLLIAVAVIYVIVGNYSEAAFMLGAIIAVSGISFYQDNRSKKALEALQKLNEPLSTVIRNSKVIQIATHEIAVGDLCITEEGKMINADGEIVHSNDFSVNEASLTGESFSVFKNQDTEDRKIYSGTLTVSGLAVFKVEKIGSETKLGKIGKSIQEIKEERSPLQIQITKFVKWMAVIGIVVFLMVWAYSFWQSRNIIESLLVGLTLAMSILPEEIPVAFTTFMALGAWKLMREGIIIKRSSVVETLGSTTVICTDKTGTITENSMRLKALFDYKSNQVFDEERFNAPELSELIEFAMWSSEPVPFDPMEKTLHEIYEQAQPNDRRKDFQMVHEYPLDGKPPMMTHLFENHSGERIVAAKGAPEAILAVSNLSEYEKDKLRQHISDFGKQGYRILGVAKCYFKGNNFPEKQQDFNFDFLGFTVFYDPPKKNIQQVFKKIYDAGIKVKVITGDNADTTNAIARQAGIVNHTPAVNGAEIIHHSEVELIELSKTTTLFTRMFPEAKLAIVNALKQNGEVVAMLGDGVNDAPALKAAHIGVAMGNKGTEIAKAAASLVITNDDLDKLITGIAAGRRIYANIKKAIQYIISIHIPIILTVSLPLFLGWIYPHIFTPVHVIFLELIMGPTCSIVYENEPIEKNAMLQKPRKMTETFLNRKELSISIIQGLIITAGVLFVYQFAVQKGSNEETTRAMVFTTLIFSNIFLSLANRSLTYSIFDSFKYKNRLFPVIIGATLALLFAILYIPRFADFFNVTGLNIPELGMSYLISAASVLWFEMYKWIKRR